MLVAIGGVEDGHLLHAMGIDFNDGSICTLPDLDIHTNVSTHNEIIP